MPFILVPDNVTNENKNKKMKWDFPRQTNVNANVLIAQVVRSHHQNKKNPKMEERLFPKLPIKFIKQYTGSS